MVPTRHAVQFWELENVIVINVNIDKLHSGDFGAEIRHVNGQ